MKKSIFILLTALFTVTATHAAPSDTEFRSGIYFSMLDAFEKIPTENIVTKNSFTYINLSSGMLTADLHAYRLPLNSNDAPISYSSDNPHITVDEKGTITSDGTPASALITMVCGEIIRTHMVYAANAPQTLSISPASVTLYADRPESVSLSLSCEPQGSDMSLIQWYSGDESIVYVNEKGQLFPNGVGTTSVYAQSPDGGCLAKCTVYVGLYDVQTRAVFITNAIDKLRTGSEYTLSSYIYPDSVKDKTVSWSSSDPSVLTVNENGVITAGNPGTAVITVRTSNNMTDSFEIEVSGESNVEYSVISKPVAQRIAELSSKPQFKKYGYTLDELTEFQSSLTPVKYSENRLAGTDEIKAVLDPSSHAGGYGKYQFINLGNPNGISTEVLDRYLSGKGVLSGKGQIFKDAAQRYNLSELYLVTHACLESGDGHSQLACGVEVNDTIVYNLFGIGAFDSDAVKYGSEYAYSMGWTSVDAAIDGGARWISENYINNTSFRQNTLYKMRWNPDSPGDHQYATDIDWATAQAKTLKTMFDAFPTAELSYEIPLYKDEQEFELK